MKDYYKVLGVAPTSSQDEIKAQYRKLARRDHPDFNPGNRDAEARLKEYNEAYAILGDPGKRREYDGNREPVFDRSFFVNLFHSDLLRTVPTPAWAARRSRGRDLMVEIALSFLEAARGAVRAIHLLRQIGTYLKTEVLNVRVPAGVFDGATLRVSEKGAPGSFGGPPGDLHVKCRVQPDARFVVEGQDVVVEARVPYPTLILGGTIVVESLSGPREVVIRPGKDICRPVVIEREGLPRLDGKGQGNFVVKLKLDLPQHNQAQLDALRRYAESLDAPIRIPKPAPSRRRRR